MTGNKVKIAIFPSHSLAFPKEFKEQDKEDGRHIRVRLAEWLEFLPINKDIEQVSGVHYEQLKNGTIDYLKYDNETLVFKHPRWHSTYTIKIIEVDTSRKWKIHEYDGAESILYFEEPVVVDASLNLCEWN